MSQRKDYYEILCVMESATQEQIKQAFRKKAIELHPDKNGGCEKKAELFKEVNEAYSVVGDEQKRRQYDAARRPVHVIRFQWGFYGNTSTSTTCGTGNW